MAIDRSDNEVVQTGAAGAENSEGGARLPWVRPVLVKLPALTELTLLSSGHNSPRGRFSRMIIY